MLDWRSDQRHAGYWYDGETVTYYSYDENNYAIVDAPETTMEMITAVNQDYGVDFPAADFFYPTFTDDLIVSSDQIRMLGKKVVDGEPCFHIVATSPSQSIQLWIAADSFNLSVRAVLTDLTAAHMPAVRN